MRLIDDVDGLTAADLVHRRPSTLPAAATVGELRDFFTSSTSHRVALLTDGERYVGSVEPSAIPADADADAVGAAYATLHPMIAPDAPARRARDIALAQPSLRLPVVDAAGALVGIVAVTKHRDGFCGT